MLTPGEMELDSAELRLLGKLPAGIRNDQREIAMSLARKGLACWTRPSSNHLDLTAAGRVVLKRKNR